MTIVVVRTPEAMRALGARIAGRSDDGIVLGLRGPLGAGKTEFVRGFVAHFGVSDVSSPSFVLENEYPAGEKILHHWDLFRVKQPPGDLLELCERPGEIVLIEWPEHVEEQMLSLSIEIRVREDESREVLLSGTRACEFVGR